MTETPSHNFVPSHCACVSDLYGSIRVHKLSSFLEKGGVQINRVCIIIKIHSISVYLL